MRVADSLPFADELMSDIENYKKSRTSMHQHLIHLFLVRYKHFKYHQITINLCVFVRKYNYITRKMIMYACTLFITIYKLFMYITLTKGLLGFPLA